MGITKNNFEEIKASKDTGFSDSTALMKEQTAGFNPSHPQVRDKPVKKSITIRVDMDVLEWFKDPGVGYQTRMNAILREAMMKANEAE
jgi:uncharacterized protein (DUF4415 family)